MAKDFPPQDPTGSEYASEYFQCSGNLHGHYHLLQHDDNSHRFVSIGNVEGREATTRADQTPVCWACPRSLVLSSLFTFFLP